jgi:hypothetical protein
VATNIEIGSKTTEEIDQEGINQKELDIDYIILFYFILSTSFAHIIPTLSKN